MNRPSKRDKRIAREYLKLEHQENKSARLRTTPAGDRDVRTAGNPGTSKTPRSSKNPGSISQMRMEWTTAMVDQEGVWAWGEPRAWSGEHWSDLIHPNLSEFEMLTWAEIWAQRTGGRKRHKKHHDMEVRVLRDEAVERWGEIGELGEITFRFRLGNRRRLWGYRQVNKFHLIWWDPTHKIYPTDPD
ncbi:MAG: hypothetical protein JKY27_02040 [Magnetovibrio sp.]|nr:hypothetical protein [Magnetovibrio sp.]